MAIDSAVRYPGISAQGFAHPADRAATAAIHTVPVLEKVIKAMTEHGYERRMRQLLLGNSVRVGGDQLPAVWAMQRRCANTLDISRCPHLYVTQEPVGNGLTIGTNEPVTLVSSGLVASYSEEELGSVLAHEMGHVLADHVGLTTTFKLVQQILGGVIRSVPLAGIPLVAIYMALLEWSRAAELTADRASAVVTGEPLVLCRSLMRIAGGPVKDLDLDAFIRQATEYHEEPDPFARYSRFFAEITTTHPFPVRRVRELVNWVASGELDRIRSGSYLRRGQEPPP
ncbi:MAG: M48 family metallopeptidase, partial [Acidimicrobiales bacterium]